MYLDLIFIRFFFISYFYFIMFFCFVLFVCLFFVVCLPNSKDCKGVYLKNSNLSKGAGSLFIAETIKNNPCFKSYQFPSPLIGS